MPEPAPTQDATATDTPDGRPSEDAEATLASGMAARLQWIEAMNDESDEAPIAPGFVRCRLVGEGEVLPSPVWVEVRIPAGETFKGDQPEQVQRPLSGGQRRLHDGWLSIAVNAPAGEMEIQVQGYHPVTAGWEGLQEGGVVYCGTHRLTSRPTMGVLGEVRWVDGAPPVLLHVEGCGTMAPVQEDGSYYLEPSSTDPCAISIAYIWPRPEEMSPGDGPPEVQGLLQAGPFAVVPRPGTDTVIDFLLDPDADDAL